MTQVELKELKEQLKDLLDKGFIRLCHTLGCFDLVCKEENGSLKTCIDYRKLIKITIKNKHLFQRINDFFDQLQGVFFFSKVDLRSSYNP